ncbi:hypothetical protein [Kineosporia sp. R_H_3]|uniref:hypothetical protein n=1 Tax=Kineosporia sp. R_H_3 TaxID=1961848 RepID=UPI0018EA17DC|nr:hypothetical protein [Kineosporia sp. R_H_3]
MHQHDRKITDPLVRAEVEVLLLTGKAMDFAARLKGHQPVFNLTHELVHRYARYVGLGALELTSTVLPALKRAGLVEYALDQQGRITHFEEYVGVSASVVEQTVQLLESLSPTRADLAFLHSVEIGAIAPLLERDHLDQLIGRGFTEQEATTALRLARAVGLNLGAPSPEANSTVIYSPYVWGTRQLSLAKFLSELPPNERGVLLGMSEQVLSTPGLHLSRLTATPALVRSAQNAGLIQAATVQSSTGAASTYVFSPLIEAEDNGVSTTEALHLRKLFVAHILFGHEKARAGLGTINNPAVLVNSLVNKGRVGPATNISTDYHLLEAAGVVAVETTDDRAFLRLVKPEIAKAGLDWLRKLSNPEGPQSVSLTQRPARFVSPEDARSEQSAGAANEVMVASVLALREEMQRATRRDDPWS